MIERHKQGQPFTGDPDADDLLRNDPNAILIGVLLDQQIRAEVAFTGPLKLKQRLGHLDLERIADMDEEAFREVFSDKPAVHRFSTMMADRVQQLARAIKASYNGSAAGLWQGSADRATVETRVAHLPGFGKAKVATLLHALDVFGHRSFTTPSS